jgi:AAA family ATP:ADP antiporter
VELKKQARVLHPSAEAYQQYASKQSSSVGIATFLLIFLGSNLRRRSFTAAMVATPVAMAALAVPFWALVYNKGDIALVVAIGSILTTFSKASKNALFDPTTQAAYIPLSADEKIRGKAAIDVIGSRFGKSGSSLLQQLVMVALGSTFEATLAVCFIYYTVLSLWISAAFRLSSSFECRQAKAKE